MRMETLDQERSLRSGSSEVSKNLLKTATIVGFITLVTIWADVVTDYDRSVDMSGFKSYAWLKRDKLGVLNRGIPEESQVLPAASIDAFIRQFINAELKKKGFTRVEGEKEADFMVAHILVTMLDIESREYDTQPGSGQLTYGHWRPFYNTAADVRLQRKGTLTIDIVDPGNNKLIWRGSRTDSIDESKVNQKEIKKRLEKAVKKILKKFPPK